MSAKSLAFSIHGDYITSLTRDLVLEEKWRKAMKILDDMHGMTLDQKVELLKGNKRFR